MPKILVTGGTGYIGSHTVVELIANSYEVVIIDNLSNSRKEVLDGIKKISGIMPEFFVFDLCDLEKTEKFFQKNKIDAIIHFASYKAVGESVQNPLKYYRNNLVSLMNLLEMAIKYEIANFVFSSSCTVYGETKNSPINEEEPVQKPASPYGNTKKIAEEIISDVACVNSFLKIISLRYFNPIGAHESALIGEEPRGIPANLVPYITQTAIGKREELKVFGNDYNTKDGTCIRDFIHVVDLAQAHIKAVDCLLKNKNQNNLEIFNLGTGQGFSVLELIKAFEEVSGEKLNYKIVERREGDIMEIYADTKKANEILGWKAKKNIKEALLSAWNWEKAN